MLLNVTVKGISVTNGLDIIHCLKLRNLLNFRDQMTLSSSREEELNCGGPFTKRQSVSQHQCAMLNISVLYIAIHNYQNSFEIQ